jgi:predicted alpha/beta-fold hydrolase
MKYKAEQQYLARCDLFPDSFDIDAVRNAETIGEYDDAYIAKIYGFTDKFDYYRQCGSKWWLSKIRVPVVAINALDDPFIDKGSLPNEDDVKDAPVRLIYPKCGGHCGFTTNRMSTERGSPSVPSHGWLQEEMARIIDHFRSQHLSLSNHENK